MKAPTPKTPIGCVLMLVLWPSWALASLVERATEALERFLDGGTIQTIERIYRWIDRQID